MEKTFTILDHYKAELNNAKKAKNKKWQLFFENKIENYTEENKKIILC